MIVAFPACEENADEVLSGKPSIELVGMEDNVLSFDADGGECQVTLIANRKWTAEETADWIQVNPTSGTASADEQTVTIKVVKNEEDEDDPMAGFDREADIKFTVGAKSVYVTVTQEGPQGSVATLVVYSNDFDVSKAEKSDPNAGWDTYLDSFTGWNNATGTGLETVTYSYDRITARTNSGNGSAGKYSIYDGSGVNYLWFGSGKPYFMVKGLTLPEGKRDFTISFGTERYAFSETETIDNTFNWDEFKAYVSNDGLHWVELKCEFAGGNLPNGQWDLASSTIRVPEGTQTLSLYFTSSVESAYALDDLKIESAFVVGTEVDFSAGEEFDPEAPATGESSDETAIYNNNYDKQSAVEAENGWPYLDKTDVWQNAAGTGAANVTYASSGASVRNNANSNGTYSDYAGSGLNNIFFGKSAYFATKNIALNGASNLTLTFGTEKYSQSLGNVFTKSEFHIWLSNDGGSKWVEFTDYTYAGDATPGRWNIATANFTVPAGTETISICIQVDAASAYRLDDLKLVESAAAGTSVDFANAVEKDFANPSGGNQGGTESDGTAIYSNNYDKETATKTYGSSGSSWPYLDQFSGWKNAAGTGAAEVDYNYSGTSARDNSNSNGTYSDYAGSGLNNIFFGSNAYFSTNNIALNGATTLTLTFGADKFLQNGNSTFSTSEYLVYVSNDGSKWVPLPYEFAGTEDGRWNVATAHFTVPEGTANISICMEVTVASAYRLDDFKLVEGTEAGTVIDFAQGVEKDFSAGGTTGGTDTPGEVEDPSTVETITCADFIEKADPNTTYRLIGEVVSSVNTTYCSFDMNDGTGTVVVWTVNNKDEWKNIVKQGGTVTVRGKYTLYNNVKHEMIDAYIEEFVPAEGGEVVTPPSGEAGQFDSELTWTLGSASYDNTSTGNSSQKATINGVSVSNILKFGKGSGSSSSPAVAGDATLHVPAGTAKIGFYAVGWKNTNVPVKFSIAGTELETVTAKANDGATGNPTYTITVSDSDYYEVELPSAEAVEVKVETYDTAGKNHRAILFGIKPIAE